MWMLGRRALSFKRGLQLVKVKRGRAFVVVSFRGAACITCYVCICAVFFARVYDNYGRTINDEHEQHVYFWCNGCETNYCSTQLLPQSTDNNNLDPIGWLIILYVLYVIYVILGSIYRTLLHNNHTVQSRDYSLYLVRDGHVVTNLSCNQCANARFYYYLENIVITCFVNFDSNAGSTDYWNELVCSNTNFDNNR